MEKIEIKRCAVYVRKSTEQGLEQQYNSLDAQRDSALAYIKSQEANGWQFTKEYRDGGFSGGNINRPALHELIADIKAGKVSVAEVLDMEGDVARRMKVKDLICSVPGYGEAKAAKLMDRIGIAESRRVQGLGIRQREALLAALED